MTSERVEHNCLIKIRWVVVVESIQFPRWIKTQQRMKSKCHKTPKLINLINGPKVIITSELTSETYIHAMSRKFAIISHEYLLYWLSLWEMARTVIIELLMSPYNHVPLSDLSQLLPLNRAIMLLKKNYVVCIL